MRCLSALPLLAALLLPPAPAAAQLPADIFVDEVVSLDPETLATIGTLLPELPNAGAAFLSPSASTTILLTAPGEVSVVLVRDGSDWRNAVGSFTFGGNPTQILSRQLVFPDASADGLAGQLPLGAAATLRDEAGAPAVFPAGTRLGLFVAADGADAAPIQSWDATSAGLPSMNPAVNAGVGRGLYSTIDILNHEQALGRPDVSRHAVVLPVPGLLPGEQALLVGFELHDRTVPACDHDFNDLVLLVRGPGFQTVNLAAPFGDDPDGDGARGSDDAWPADPTRAQVTRYPSSGFRLLTLDDGYPAAGDGDANDAVLATAFQLVTGSDGRVAEILGELHLLARGPATSTRLGLHIPGLPQGDGGTVAFERFLGDAAATHAGDILPLEDVVTLLDRRLEFLLPDLGTALPALPKPAPPEGAEPPPDVVNTWLAVQAPAASARLSIVFETPVEPGTLGPPPWDVYWLVSVPGQGTWDVHRPGLPAFGAPPTGVPPEQGAAAFQDDEQRPWVLDLGRVQRFPTEGTSLHKMLPGWLGWAASHGGSSLGWEHQIVGQKASPPAGSFLRTLDWSLHLTSP